MEPRVATVDDAEEIARLLHDFNTEYDTPSPGVAFLALRLRELLAGDGTFALLAGEPAVAVGLITLRTNVWYEGQVALLDELYVAPELRGGGIGAAMIDLLLVTARERGVDLVEINVDAPDVDAQRFYERHGFHGVDPDTGDRAYYYFMEL
ncbi:MAG: GNAT family N-acetyltransferase [Actinomycetota bacterium]|nr:GNAT family N-acetyltransferase [Actinomycetota bacterium]